MNCPKHPYETEHAARVALVGAIVRRNSGANQRRERRAYRCLCGAWHLSSQERPGEAK